MNGRCWLAVAVWGCLLPPMALAHLTNEASLFDDIATLEEASDIVLLSAVGLVPEAQSFDPYAPITRRDLATWVAEGSNGQTSGTTSEEVESAVMEGRVQSLEGDATLAEVAAAFFGEEIDGVSDVVPSRAEAAEFLAEVLTTSPKGAARLAEWGIATGPQGVAQVETETGENGGNIHYLTLGNVRAAGSAHLRLAGGPSNLKEWEGRDVSRSLLQQTQVGLLSISSRRQRRVAQRVEESPMNRQDEHRPAAWTQRVMAGLIGLAFWAFAVAPAVGHIKNEQTQFPDIEHSDARFDVVFLAAVGMISETPVFEPEQPLSRRDLASWVALAEGLGEGGETPDTDALARAALETGRVASLEGQATLGDLAAAFFGDAVAPEVPDTVPTKAEAAQFVAVNMDTPVNGRSLLDRAGIQPGPTGPVEAVEAEQQADGENVYFVTVGDTRLAAFQHMRVANGPTDLLAWEDRTIESSFTRDLEGAKFWIYLEAEPLPPASSTAEVQPATEGPIDEGSPALLIALVGTVLALGALLFARRRRSP